MAYDAVQYGICDGLLTDHVVPVFYGYLRGPHCRSTQMPILDDIHQYAPSLRVGRQHTEVVEDQQVLTFDTLNISQYRAFCLGYLSWLISLAVLVYTP